MMGIQEHPKTSDLERVQAAFAGIVIGDTAGESVEELPSATTINGRHVKLAGSWDVFPSASTAMIMRKKRKIWEYAKIAGVAPEWTKMIPDRIPFCITDDSHLSFIVGDCIAHQRGWNLAAQVASHIKHLDEQPKLWGPTIRAGVIELRNKQRQIGEPARRGALGTGLGNGPCMRSLTLGLWRALHTTENTDALIASCFELGLMTHWDIRASVAAFAVARFAELLFRHTPLFLGHGKRLLAGMIREVEYMEDLGKKKYPDNVAEDDPHAISQRLNHLLSANLKNTSSVSALWGTQGQSLITAPYVIGMTLYALSKDESIERAMVSCVRAGGDTDTNASILGGLLGITYGWRAFPAQWRYYVPIQEHLKKADVVATRFYHAAER